MNLVAGPLLIPIVTALVCLATREVRRKDLVSLVGAVALLVNSVSLLGLVSDGGHLGLLLGGWKAPHGITFVVDTLGAIMLVLSSIALMAACLCSIGDGRKTPHHPLRLPLLHFLTLGINLSFLTGDFFNLFVAFEVMLLSSYALMTLESKDIRQGYHYVLINVIGSTFFLCLAGYAYGTWGTLNYADLAVRLAAEPSRPKVVLFGALCALVFGLKAGVFPLYYWLPRSYPTLPPAVAGIFAGMLTKVGVYVLLRMFATVLPPGLTEVYALVGALSVGAMIFGVLGALSRKTISGILSYHIISQVGYMTLCIGILSPLAVTACIAYIVHHIVVKSSLFVIGGAAQKIEGTEELEKMGGLWKFHAPLGMLFLLQAFSLAGIPPLSGFWGKYLILVETVRQEQWLYVAAILVAGLLTLVSMLKIWTGAFWGTSKNETRTASRPPDLRLYFWTSVGLCTFSLWVGLGFPAALRLAEVASRSVLDQQSYVHFVKQLSGGSFGRNPSEGGQK